MQEFWFYVQLGLHHVLDINAYDHILFLSALVLPYTFNNWKNVLLLATVFTITHCLALVVSVYELWVLQVEWIEFLIPVTILITAIFNIIDVNRNSGRQNSTLKLAATGFFGLIHGFGFSNYFKMMVMGEEDKLTPLLGFASGIELSQVCIVLLVLLISFLLLNKVGVQPSRFITYGSILVILITMPLLYNTFPI